MRDRHQAHRADEADASDEAGATLLAVRYLEGDLSDDELTRFDELLQQSPGCAERLYGLTNLALNVQEAGHAALATALPLAPPRSGAKAIHHPLPWRRAAVAFLKHHAALSLTVAALFLATVVLVLWKLPVWEGHYGEPAITDWHVVAHVVATHGAEWAPASLVHGQPPRDMVAGEPVELVAGSVAIRFASGAVATLEGPATFTAHGRLSLELHGGKLAARVPPQAIGFAVRTPEVNVVDLGTEFSVGVAKHETEVSVQTGVVEVRPRAAAGEAPYRLSSGQAFLFGRSPGQGFYAKEKVVDPASFSSLTALVGEAPAPRQAPTILLAGFDDGSGRATQDSSVAGGKIVARLVGAARGGVGTDSPHWGTASLQPPPRPATSRVRGNSAYTLTLSLTNHTGCDVVLGTIHYALHRVSNDAARLQTVYYAGGDLRGVGAGEVIFSEAMRGKYLGGFTDFDIPLSQVLNDVVLADGESAAFSITIGRPTSTEWTCIDNVAISGVVVPRDPAPK